MRHTGSGLAIPDFPTMGGYILPRFDSNMLSYVNNWRFEHDLPPVILIQIFIHFIHRLWALAVIIAVCFLNYQIFKSRTGNRRAISTLYWLDIFLFLQLTLGALTVLSQKSPVITSVHVVMGAAALGVCVLLSLRMAPLSMVDLKKLLK